MEYHVEILNRRLVVTWNGSDAMEQHTIRRFTSRALNFKILLFLPEMPISHRVTMCRRLLRTWETTFQTNSRAARSVLGMPMLRDLREGINLDDSILVPVLNYLGLDDVCRDIDLICIYRRRRVHGPTLTFVFGFSPDNLDHFLTHHRRHVDAICYGPNGDDSV